MVLIAEYLISLSITQNTFSNVIILSTLFVCLGMLLLRIK